MGKLTTQDVKDQVKQYSDVWSEYEQFAKTLKQVLKDACKQYFPNTSVEARAKTIPSFAEKVIRKADKYQNAITDMTDLSAARVIVQTQTQAEAVREFIRKNFYVCEEDDKGASLGEDVFGYGDVHFIVQIKNFEKLGISDKATVKAIGEKKAEIQVRTWLQHALADTLHDRLYKTPLKFPREINRLAKMLDAIRENADKALTGLCKDIDERLANYSSYTSRKDIEEEIRQLTFVLQQQAEKDWRTALKCAHRQTAIGEYKEAIQTLDDYAKEAHSHPRVLVEIGDLYRLTGKPREAIKALTQAIERLEHEELHVAVPYDKALHNALKGRAHFRLAKVYDETKRDCETTEAEYQKALDCNPSHRSYLLSEFIGYLLRHKKEAISELERNAIKSALKVCRENIEVWTDMPYSCFTAGRLNAFLGDHFTALADYALGVTLIGKQMVGVPKDILERERAWLSAVANELKKGDPIKEACGWCVRLLKLAEKAKLAEPQEQKKAESVPKTVSVKIISGGAAKSLASARKKDLSPLIESILKDFEGTVYSGGTKKGVPDVVGDIAKRIGIKREKLLCYLPKNLPADAPPHPHYKMTCAGNTGFTPEQILTCFEALTKGKFEPSKVNLFGFGGGVLCAFEYRLALMLGIKVWLFDGFGGTATQLGKDDNWMRINDLSLFIVPDDKATHEAFINQGKTPPFDETQLNDMGEQLHVSYLNSNREGSLKNWNELDDTFKEANKKQAAYSLEIIKAAGFNVVGGVDAPTPITFTDDEIEDMAKLEHGRWVVERLRAGWRYGKKRDNERKIHPLIVPWNDLSEADKEKDRKGVITFLALLAQVGWEVRRK